MSILCKLGIHLWREYKDTNPNYSLSYEYCKNCDAVRNLHFKMKGYELFIGEATADVAEVLLRQFGSQIGR